jgi:hypothetical protein
VKKEAGSIRRLAVLHELADDVVYSGNMVGVERMPQAEQIRKASDAEQRRPIGEGDPYPDPGCGIAAQQHTIGHRCLGPGKGRPIVERVRQHERVLLATRHAGMGPNGAPRLARAALNSASGYPIPRAEFHAEGIDPVEWCGAEPPVRWWCHLEVRRHSKRQGCDDSCTEQ